MAEVGKRVKFSCTYLGSLVEWRNDVATRMQVEQFDNLLPEMSAALGFMEQTGIAPIAPDGLVAGNAAAVLGRSSGSGEPVMLVSRSSRRSGQLDAFRDFCVVTYFDEAAWSCGYFAASRDLVPTSDTPLHRAALLEGQGAAVSLHGHEFETPEKAAAIGVPCSNAVTLFSTPEDTEALTQLMRENPPYPVKRMFVRRGHGFLILSDTFSSAVDLLEDRLRALHNWLRRSQSQLAARSYKGTFWSVLTVAAAVVALSAGALTVIAAVVTMYLVLR